MPEFDVTAEFSAAFDRAVAQEKSPFPQADWLAAGYRPQQDGDWWRGRGPQMCQEFISWYQSQPSIRIWTTPDGRPAIELDLEVLFGAVPVKMAPDLILQAGTALVVVDLKSGSSVPESRRQLGIYACGIEAKYKVRPKYGTFFMAKGITRKGSDERTYFLPPISLDEPQYSYPYLCREFAEFDRAVKSGIFLANPGANCRTCGVNRACTAFGGEQAAIFDYPGRQSAH